MGVAGYNYTMTFDDGGGAQTLGAVDLDLAIDFDTDDITETAQAGQSIIVTLQRATVSGSFVVEDTGDDTPKDDFEAAANAGTSVEIVIYPTGNSSGNRSYTFTAYITSLSISNNGPAGSVRGTFSLALNDGAKVAISTV
jgi:hypothetical protein